MTLHEKLYMRLQIYKKNEIKQKDFKLFRKKTNKNNSCCTDEVT